MIRKRRNVLILMILALLSGCFQKNRKEEKEKNDVFITSISLSRSSCYNGCPVYSIEMDSSLNVKFLERSEKPDTVYYTSNLSIEQWRRIKSTSVDVYNFFAGKDTTLPQLVHDDAYIDLILKTREKSIRIQGYSSFLPKEILLLLGTIDKTRKELQFEESSSRIVFRTKIQE